MKYLVEYGLYIKFAVVDANTPKEAAKKAYDGFVSAQDYNTPVTVFEIPKQGYKLEVNRDLSVRER